MSRLVPALQVIGYALLCVDVVWWLTWVVFTGLDIRAGKLDNSATGLSALSTPHTTIIPTLVSIQWDLYKHCNNGACTLKVPPPTWFVVPAVLLPRDVLGYYLQARRGDATDYQTVLSLLSLVVSSCVLAWSVVSFATIFDAVSRRKTPAKLATPFKRQP